MAKPDPHPEPKFAVDDPIWIHWSNRTEAGWITAVHKVHRFHNPDEWFWMYEILQKDGSGPEYGRVAERLIARRDI